MLRKALLGMMVLVTGAGLAMAGTSNLWLHIKVDEGRGDEQIRVNIPLSLVEQLLPLIKVEDFNRGKLRIDHLGLDDEFDGIDFMEIWEAVRNLDDAEFVRVQGDDGEDVRVFKEGNWLFIKASEGRDGRVEVRFPLAVVDALFSGEPGELDVLAAVEALGKYGRGGDLVRVTDGDTNIRVWIDDRNVDD